MHTVQIQKYLCAYQMVDYSLDLVLMVVVVVVVVVAAVDYLCTTESTCTLHGIP